MATTNPLATLSKMPPEILLLIAEATAPVAPMYIRDETQNLSKACRSKADRRARTKKTEKDMFSLLLGLAGTSRYIRASVLPVFWAKAAFGLKITSRRLLKTVVNQFGQQDWESRRQWTVSGMIQTTWTTMHLTKMNASYVYNQIQRLELDFEEWLGARVDRQFSFPSLKHLTIACKPYQSPCIQDYNGNWQPSTLVDGAMCLDLLPMDRIMKEWYQVLRWTNLETISIRRVAGNDSRLRTYLEHAIDHQFAMRWPVFQPSQDPLERQVAFGVGYNGMGGFNAFGATRITEINTVLEKLDAVFFKQVYLLMAYCAENPQEGWTTEEYDYYDTWNEFETNESSMEIYKNGLQGVMLSEEAR